MATGTSVRTISVGKVMDEAFVVVLARWTMERLVDFLRKARYSHIVILRHEGDERYRYLYSRKEVKDVITRSQPNSTVHDAFNLHEYTSTRETPADADAGSVTSDRAIVMDDGRVVGFIDSRVPPEPQIAFDARSVAVPPAIERVQAQKAFSAFPALTAPDSVPPDDPFDIFVGFRDRPDPKVRGGGEEIRVSAPTGDDCLVVLSGDGVTLDKDHDYVPLKSNALVRFSGKINAGVTQASVKALYIYKQQVIGSARREIAVTGAAEVGPLVESSVANPCRMQAPRPENAVDVTISLNSKRDGTLEWRIIAPGYPKAIETMKLETSLPDTKQFAADLMRDLRALNFRGNFARNVLETVGQEIASYLPAEVFDVLQKVHAAINRPPTLLLLTNETYVPWELAYLATPLDSTAPPFLAAQTVMGRWIEEPTVMLPPMVSLDVKRITAVASEYGLAAGQRQLLQAKAEQATLCTKWQAVPLEATADEMEAMVTGAKIAGHLVHFAVHGYSDPAANNQTLLLADKTQLPATAMTGAYTCGATPRFSFVFLNACQVGTPGRSLGHAGGFPGVLVRGGTIGFIAPLWDVHDDIARAAAEAFYEETFSGGTSVGAALQVRRKAYANDSTTPLAYIYYGHPGLRLNRMN